MKNPSGSVSVLHCFFAVTISILFEVTACSSEISTVNGSYPCIKLTTSPYTYYEKFCPLSEIGFNFFTFICDVNSGYVSWEFGGLLRTFIGHEERREYRNYTSEFKYHLVRHISENLIDDIYTMRSSLTIFPYNYSFIQFPLVCSTHCGEQPVSMSKVYKVADIPTKPTNLRGYNTNSHGICSDGHRVVFEWQHPDNINMTALSHYEYFFKNQTDVIQRTAVSSPSSFVYILGVIYTFEFYYFEVYAVDMCGRHGEHAVTTYPLQDTTESSGWWPF